MLKGAYKSLCRSQKLNITIFFTFVRRNSVAVKFLHTKVNFIFIGFLYSNFDMSFICTFNMVGFGLIGTVSNLLYTLLVLHTHNY
jgi:hypothetical protein